MTISLFSNSYIIGIVGCEEKKFTSETEGKAKELIRILLSRSGVTGISSGHCHLGGIDIWAEDIGKELGLETYIFPPKDFSWSAGYKLRNIQIVEASDEVHCITVKRLPDAYQGMRFESCYHCGTDSHVKSGGCWTAKYADKKGKPAYWHVL